MSTPDEFIQLLQGQPDVLAPAGVGASVPDFVVQYLIGPALIDRRVDEDHLCLKCGADASDALLFRFAGTWRYLDLCHAHAHWMDGSADCGGFR